MIRTSRLALFASCSLALAACSTVKTITPHFGARHPKAPAPAAEAQVDTPSPSPVPRHRRFALRRVDKPAMVVASGPVGKAPPMDVWAQSYADLPPDPRMRFGTLPNGLRYVVMKNATPGGQASLRLRIDAGSIDETDTQQGLAHFLEHLAFDGSTHVPKGEMVKILERHGLAFGADTNASTGWDETVFKLDLPKADDDTVDTSLMLLREVASNLTLAPDAIDGERGIVLSEERLRDTPGYHVTKQSLAFTLQGLRAADRFPIGKVEVIQHADHDLIADFYNKYYRPSRAVMIAVGDFDPDAMEARIKARFGDWSNTAPAGGEPELGRPAPRGAQTRVVVEPGTQQMVELNWVAAPDNTPDSAARRRRITIESLALAVLNRRLDALVRADDPPFAGAGAYRQDQFHSAEVTTIQAGARPGEWQKALDSLDHETRRLIQYGVSADELAQEIDATRATLKSAADGEATRSTPSVADDIVGTLETPEVETSAVEDLALFDRAVKGLTPADIAAALRTMFSGSGPLLFISTPDPIEGGEAAVTKAYAAAQKTPVTAQAAQAALHWPYESFGAPGEVAERRDIADLDTVFIRFQNGVRLTVKPTKFADDQILVEARIGHGQLDLPNNHATAAWAAASAFPEGGLKQLSAQDIDQVLRSRILGRSFAITDDAFTLSGVTRPDDLDTQLQLLTAYVAEPGWRPEAFARMHNSAPTILDQLAATPAGVLSRDVGRLLHNGDYRWGYPSRAEIAAETPADLKGLLAPALATGQIDVVMVGDITVEKAIDAVAATFGALPARAPQPAPSGPSATVTFPPATATPVTLTHGGRADQAIGLVAWPIEDFLSDTQRARTLSILGEVMQLRITDDLRKAQGLTYSPSAAANPSPVFAHYGYISARVEIPPGKLGAFYSDVAGIARDLREKDVTPDELNRAKKPAVDDLERRRETNEYWRTALAGAQADPRWLTAIRSSVAQLEHVSAADLRRAAQTYLTDDKAWKLEVKPKAAP